MQSTMRRTLASGFLGLLALSAAGCVSAPPINATHYACSRLVEPLLQETPGARLPADDTAAELAKFGDLQTGQLDKANADKSASRHVLSECERMQAEAVKPPKRWGLF